MMLKYTRAMISAALSGELDNVKYKEHPIFNLQMPQSCPNVPDNLLDPRNTWASADNYDEKANGLAIAFIKNFEQYAPFCKPEIINAAPNATVSV
jgi:phosphoenolpyruvate carboxykinase (ATP)